MTRARRSAGTVLVAALSLTSAACTEAPPPPAPEATEVPEELRAARAAPTPAAAAQVAGSTPMAERTATIGVLNKRNNLTQDLEMKPGETRRLGNLVVRLAACERTAPWEVPRETGAFVQVLVQERGEGGQEGWRRVFSGWMFKNSPSLNVVEHPIYDVWVKDCAMSFPGEEGTGSTGSPEGNRTPNAERSPDPAPRPAAASPAPTA